MGAYGFNADKTKARLIQTFEKTPAANEKWRNFLTRVWGEINNFAQVLGAGHITEIRAIIYPSLEREYSFDPPRMYQSDGRLYNEVGLNAVLTQGINNEGFNALTIPLSYYYENYPPYICNWLYIDSEGTVTKTSDTSADGVVPAGVKFTIYYIP